jgi:hypothetical protein
VVKNTLSVTVVGGIVISMVKVDTAADRVTLSVTVIVTGGSADRVILFVTVIVEVSGVVEAQVNGQVEGVIVTVVAGGHEEAEVVVELVVVEGELVALEEVVATPAMQVQALLIFELNAEHGDKKLGKDEVLVTRLVVYVAQNAEAEAAFPSRARRQLSPVLLRELVDSQLFCRCV